MFEGTLEKTCSMRKLLLLVSIMFLAGSCYKDEINIDPDNLLTGTWIFDKYDEDAYIFYRSTGFIDNHCYKFNSDGTLTERKNSGWCGTPPVSYADYPGTWSFKSNNEIEINIGYWGGTINYKLNILHVNNDSLKVTIEYLN
jgi:hypothetical protein